MVGQVLDERRIPSLAGDLAVAHCRYSTTGSTVWENAQPTLRLGPRRSLAIGHNGNLVNTRELLGQLQGGRGRLPASTDTELLTALLADEPADDTVDALRRVLPRVRGAYSLVVLDERQRHRRPRPARVPARSSSAGCRSTAEGGELPGLWGDDTGGWILASETAALDIVGATYVRDVEPGEIVVLEPGREPVSRCATRRPRPALCVFELIYFARPDSYMEGRNLYEARRHMGMQLAARAPGGRRPRDARPGHGRAGRGGLRRGVRHPVPRGHGPQPVQRPDVHPALAGDAPAGRQRQAQPAARGRPRPAAHRRGRLDRARHDDQADRRAAAARRRARGPRPDQRPADLPPVLLRDRHLDRDRAHRGHPLGRGDPRLHRRGLARLPLDPRRARGARAAVRALLLRLLRRQLPGARPVRRRRAQVPARDRRGAARGDDAADVRAAYAGAGVDVAAGRARGGAHARGGRVDAHARRSSAASAGSARRSRSPTACASRSSSPRRTASGRRPRSPRRSAATTRSAWTSSRCARTTSCARAPSRSPSSTTSPWGGSTRPTSRRSWRGVAAGCRQAGLRARRRRDGRAPGAHGPGRVRPRGLLRRRGERDRLLDGTAARPGDAIVGLAASGLHANGYSLVRALVADHGLDLDEPYPALLRRVLGADAAARALARRPGRALATPSATSCSRRPASTPATSSRSGRARAARLATSGASRT